MLLPEVNECMSTVSRFSPGVGVRFGSWVPADLLAWSLGAHLGSRAGLGPWSPQGLPLARMRALEGSASCPPLKPEQAAKPGTVQTPPRLQNKVRAQHHLRHGDRQTGTATPTPGQTPAAGPAGTQGQARTRGAQEDAPRTDSQRRAHPERTLLGHRHRTSPRIRDKDKTRVNFSVAARNPGEAPSGGALRWPGRRALRAGPVYPIPGEAGSAARARAAAGRVTAPRSRAIPGPGSPAACAGRTRSPGRPAEAPRRAAPRTRPESSSRSSRRCRGEGGGTGVAILQRRRRGSMAPRGPGLGAGCGRRVREAAEEEGGRRRRRKGGGGGADAAAKDPGSRRGGGGSWGVRLRAPPEGAGRRLQVAPPPPSSGSDSTSSLQASGSLDFCGLCSRGPSLFSPYPPRPGVGFPGIPSPRVPSLANSHPTPNLHPAGAGACLGPGARAPGTPGHQARTDGKVRPKSHLGPQRHMIKANTRPERGRAGDRCGWNGAAALSEATRGQE